MKKILKITFNILTDILLIAALTILVLSAYTASQYKSNPEDAYLFGYKPILVLTGSMEPTMKVNSVCVAKKATYDDVEVGDIIMYKIDGKLITHRVIEETEQGFRTKGDNNNTEDAYFITENNIQAKVIHIANWTAGIIEDLQTTEGKIRWIGFPIFVIIVLAVLIAVIKKIINSPDEKEEQEDKSEEESSENPENTNEVLSDIDNAPDVIEDNQPEKSEDEANADNRQ